MNFEEQKIRYAYNGKPQQWQWGFKSGWNARQSEIDELKTQLCKVHERLELIQEEFVETETYLKEQIEQKNSKITSFKYLVEQDKIHIQSQQSRVVDLKAQLECCRKENAVLLGRVGEGEKRVSELNQWNSNQYELIKRNESHTQSLRHLLQKLIDDDYTTMRPSMAYEIQAALRGEHETY